MRHSMGYDPEFTFCRVHVHATLHVLLCQQYLCIITIENDHFINSA